MGCLITVVSQSQVLLSRLHVRRYWSLLVGIVGVPVTDILRQAVKPGSHSFAVFSAGGLCDTDRKCSVVNLG